MQTYLRRASLVLALLIIAAIGSSCERASASGNNPVYGTPLEVRGWQCNQIQSADPTALGGGADELQGPYAKGDWFYWQDRSGRVYRIPAAPEVLCLHSAYTLTNTANQQALFNVPTSGALSLKANRTYEFDCFFKLSSMSATSGNLKFSPLGLGTAGGTVTVTSCTYEAEAVDATLATPAAWQRSVIATTTADPITSSTDIATAATATVCAVHAHGFFVTNAAGTGIPAVSLTTAAAAVVDINSYFKCWETFDGSTAYIGGWS